MGKKTWSDEKTKFVIDYDKADTNELREIAKNLIERIEKLEEKLEEKQNGHSTSNSH